MKNYNANEIAINANIKSYEKEINDNPNNIWNYINIIYYLHNLLVECEYEIDKTEHYTSLLKEYFQYSQAKFSDIPEYLFFVSKIMFVAEWYFGLNDDLKEIQDKVAFNMQKKALELEPDNILFQWAVALSLNDNNAKFMAGKILSNEDLIEWLKTKNQPGKYIIEQLLWNRDN